VFRARTKKKGRRSGEAGEGAFTFYGSKGNGNNGAARGKEKDKKTAVIELKGGLVEGGGGGASKRRGSLVPLRTYWNFRKRGTNVP